MIPKAAAISVDPKGMGITFEPSSSNYENKGIVGIVSSNSRADPGNYSTTVMDEMGFESVIFYPIS